jgi:8-oxo-dGTP pyrophosphatase MutT (NUDIX family)
MLHLIPAPAHRILLRIAHRVRVRWWRLRKPRLGGCRVLALDREARVLLVRHSYGTGHWMPPGGGLGRGEDAVLAARRELLEETGCRLEWAVRLDLVEERLHGAGNSVHIVAGLTLDLPRADEREIIEAAFFAAHALPEPMPAMLRHQLPGWITAATAARPADAAPAPPVPPAPTG